MRHITLAPLSRREVGRVLHLELPIHQNGFVAPIAEMVDEPDQKQDFHVILTAKTPVGFFKIDRDFTRRISRLPPGAHGFRGLLIGGQFQGQGLGSVALAVLRDYVMQHYCISALWLSVDEANATAIKLYAACGWQPDGLAHQGRIGAEQVMRLDL